MPEESKTVQPSGEDENPDLYALDPRAVQEPPRGLRGTLKFLGPGLILVGSVVGSGEIILTTNVGFYCWIFNALVCAGELLEQEYCAGGTVAFFGCFW